MDYSLLPARVCSGISNYLIVQMHIPAIGWSIVNHIAVLSIVYYIAPPYYIFEKSTGTSRFYLDIRFWGIYTLHTYKKERKR